MTALNIMDYSEFQKHEANRRAYEEKIRQTEEALKHLKYMQQGYREVLKKDFPSAPPQPENAKKQMPTNAEIAQRIAEQVSKDMGIPLENIQVTHVPAPDEPTPIPSQGITISELQRVSHDIAQQKGWWEGGRQIPELLMLVTTEVAEAMEAYRDGLANYQFDENGKPIGFAHELADVLIRVADMADYFGINLTHAIMQKTEYNLTRPHRHGGKKA